MKTEVLLSVMNLKSKGEYLQLLKQNNITGSVIAVNQVDKKQILFCSNDFNAKIISNNEKGTSKSRNMLLENATGEVCLFADNDTIYVDNYEQIVEEEHRKRPNADIIIFYAENKNKKREINKKIGNRKINSFDVMKVRTNEITIKKESMEKIKKANIKFDNNFGPGAVFIKGEETVFINDLLKNNFVIYSVNKTIAVSENRTSSWFTGFNEKFLYDQGAIFYRIAPNIFKFLIFQYIIRKYSLYRKNLHIWQAYKQMVAGAKACKEIYG